MRYQDITAIEILEESILSNNLVHKIISLYGNNTIKLKKSLIDFKNKLSQEMFETKEMLRIYKIALSGVSVSKDELRIANEQLIDLIKLVGLLVPHLIPLPLVGTVSFLVMLKLGKIFGVNILPSSWSEIQLKTDID
jgi:hypothetical protein